MSKNPLAVIATDDKIKRSSKLNKREIAKNILDELWGTNPTQFDPLNNAIGRDRYNRTCRLIAESDLKHGKVADLGTGTAIFALYLAKKNLHVDAVDLATIPIQNIENLQNSHVKAFQDYIPQTTLDGDIYDMVLALDIIAYLQKLEHRLLMAELARLVKLDGVVIASTPLDIYSEDALQQFAELAETEFKIQKWVFSYHGYYLRLLHFFEAPSLFVKAANDRVVYAKELSKRFSMDRYIFKFNTLPVISTCWRGVSFFSNLIHQWLKQNKFTMNKLEKICRFISNEKGISHAIFMGRRRKLFEDVEADKKPIERRTKQQVWE
jgi:2-polyprenyl-3-methyl-5-hydroxy-6-metoxy-1,4-benzoquinol methylase